LPAAVHSLIALLPLDDRIVTFARVLAHFQCVGILDALP
jgi:hypothetical protein